MKQEYSSKNGIRYYKTDENGKEIYEMVNGEPIFAEKPGVGPIYARDEEGNEYYPNSIYGIQEVFLVRNGIPVYAVDKYNQPFYPKRKGRDHILKPIGPIRNSTGCVKYPLDEWGEPIYPEIDNTKFYYDGRCVGLNKAGNPVYLKEPNGDEFYPRNGSFGRNKKGEPKYAETKSGLTIFLKTRIGSEYYLKHARTLDDWIWMSNGKMLTRYAKDSDGNEKYPQRAVAHEGTQPVLTEVIMNERYAKTAQGKFFYPKDENGNEFIMKPKDKDKWSQVFAIGYPITNDNYYIIPSYNEKPLFAKRINGDIDESNLVAKIFRQETGYSDYLTNVRAERLSTAQRKNYKTTMHPNVILQNQSKNIIKNLPKTNNSSESKREIKTFSLSLYYWIAIFITLLGLIAASIFSWRTFQKTPKNVVEMMEMG